MKNKYFNNYDDYVNLQISKVGYITNFSSDQIHEAIQKEYYQGTRIGKQNWAFKLVENCTDPATSNVLVIGGRWGSDVIFLREAGFRNIIAFDLYDPPLSNLVITGDAHYLSKFIKSPIHVFWAHHVFEHFFKPSIVMKEIVKVAAPLSYMYVGIPFAPRNKYDAQDEFSTPDEFIQMMKKYSFEVQDFHENRRGKKKNKLYHFYIFRRNND